MGQRSSGRSLILLKVLSSQSMVAMEKWSIFGDTSSNCANCIGLPEERLLVLHALVVRYAVIAISSTKECWSFTKGKDKVKSILKWWIKKQKLDRLPMVALGPSSSSYFISALANEFHFISLTIMVTDGRFRTMCIPVNYPPTLFVHRPKDERRMELISEAIKTLKSKGIDVDEVKCINFPLTPCFLSHKIPGLDERTSMRIYKMFKEECIKNGGDYMTRDGWEINWKKPLRKSQVFSDAKNEWEPHIQVELNLAYGFHEMTSLHSDQIFCRVCI